jgi:predicted dehydrogenase
LAWFGYGYWGPNLARCASTDADCRLTAICDLSADRLRAAACAHPGARLTVDWRTLVGDPAIDALLLATPADTHAPMAHAALCAGKHVLVEKPIARSSQHVVSLIAEAKRRGLVLLTDHTYVFSPPVQAIRKLIAAGELGTIRSFNSVRVNGGGGRGDVDVLWDLAAHDLSIIDYLFEAAPRAVGATSFAPEGAEPEPGVCLSVFFPGPLIADIRVSWSGPARTRRILIAGSKRKLVFDDLEPVAKVQVHANDANHGDGGTFYPPLDTIEPLRNVVAHFAACILRNERPISDGAAGLRVVRLLEAASCSLSAAGTIIPIAIDEEVLA